MGRDYLSGATGCRIWGLRPCIRIHRQVLNAPCKHAVELSHFIGSARPRTELRGCVGARRALPLFHLCISSRLLCATIDGRYDFDLLFGKCRRELRGVRGVAHGHPCCRCERPRRQVSRIFGFSSANASSLLWIARALWAHLRHTRKFGGSWQRRNDKACGGSNSRFACCLPWCVPAPSLARRQWHGFIYLPATHNSVMHHISGLWRD